MNSPACFSFAESQYSEPKTTGMRVAWYLSSNGRLVRSDCSSCASGKPESIARNARDAFTVSRTTSPPQAPRMRKPRILSSSPVFSESHVSMRITLSPPENRSSSRAWDRYRRTSFRYSV